MQTNHDVYWTSSFASPKGDCQKYLFLLARQASRLAARCGCKDRLVASGKVQREGKGIAIAVRCANHRRAMLSSVSIDRHNAHFMLKLEKWGTLHHRRGYQNIYEFPWLSPFVCSMVFHSNYHQLLSKLIWCLWIRFGECILTKDIKNMHFVNQLRV